MRALDRPATPWRQTAAALGRTVMLGASLTVGIAVGLVLAFLLIRRLLEFLTL
jgi:hypothetical protein